MTLGFNLINVIYILGILFGLLLFLLGIKIMSNTFENIVSIKIRSRLNKLSSRKLLGVALGIIMTGLLQSSSATTIIIISLVHGSLIDLNNAVPIIMGANIGTTLTAQIIAFRINMTTQYFIIIVLVLIIMLKKKYKSFSNVLLGLTLIFSGLEVISVIMSSLKTISILPYLIAKLSDNKKIAFLLGILITSIIQSSSTGIAMLQIMASTKMIPVINAIPIMLGQNIGTCVNTIIGSLATNKAGKQAAIIHLFFNIIGTAIFYLIIEKFYAFIIFISPNNPARQLANAHTIFNTTSTIILLPFSSHLAKFSKKIIRE